MKKYQIRPSLICALYVILFICAAGSGQTPSSVQTPVIQTSDADLIHFGDLLDVDIVGGFEFDWRGRLTPEGFLDGLDGFGDPIFALCKSESEIAGEVAHRYSKILKDPQVVVRIIDRSNRAVATVEGSVRGSARFRLRRKATLRELLVLAGGLLDSSSGEVRIFRPPNASCRSGSNTSAGPDNRSQTLLIKIADLLKGGEGADPEILPGDIVTVLTADPIYIMGAVGNPRPIYSREELSLSRVIAMAGGLAKNADGGKITVFRREGNKTTVIDTDLANIEKGEIADEVIKPFDIIDVAARGRQKQKVPPVVVGDDSRSKGRDELPLRIVE